MTQDRQSLRWNGWGSAHVAFDLGPRETAVWDYLATALGRDQLAHHHAVPLPELSLPPCKLEAQPLAALQSILGPDHVRQTPFERAFHARGKSYLDLLALRSGDLGDHVPDAVVYPANADEVQAIIDVATRHHLAVVPYGGGSSVVGGVNASHPSSLAALITVDLTRMHRLLTVDGTALTATFEAGVYGPDLERQLQAHGYTLGHYPQSFEYSTLGGWVAARGAGQQSNRYGKAESWLRSAHLATPRGPWHTENFPASAAGPNLNQLVVGSEGTLGIITQATVKVLPVPARRDYRGYLFPNFAAGTTAVREICQRNVKVAMLRLSDPDETKFLQAFSGAQHPPGFGSRLGDRIVRSRGYDHGRCILLVGIEGADEPVLAARDEVADLCKRHGGLGLGTRPGHKWYARRFFMPYLRDPLLDRGLAVETLETAARWSDVPALYHNLYATLHATLTEQAVDAKARAIVMCHISHAYSDGASLYFTMVFPQRPPPTEAREQWLAIKHAACETILASGGTISHHHGVGTDHLPWLAREKGPVGVLALASVKHSLDPTGIMNPGKLIPAT